MEDDKQLQLHKGRHSLAHIMAYAIGELYDNVKFSIGPNIENGFYYDFDLEHVLTEADFEKITNRMREIINKKLDFVKQVITRQQALSIFKDQPYKIELIKDFAEDEEISTYQVGEFLDLCKGPHVANTAQLLSWDFKLSSVTGAYFKGDSDNKMLQRVYAYAFPDKKQLKQFLNNLEEAKKRDHRVLGPQLDLFFLDETAPGMPYWLPKGNKMVNVLLDFWRKEHEKRGYMEVATPLINSADLWHTSGHWEHYQDNMFVIPLGEGKTFAVKPMNCPNAMKVFARKVVSYRDLPMRISDCDTLHRKEISGTLHGLLRVQSFRQDDAHIFVKDNQIFEEINNILEIADLFYAIFGLTYKPVLSTRPKDFMGDIKLWDKAEAELKTILDTRYGKGNYHINHGDGAFYGPKIDIMMEDALKRTWQMGTIQLDFQLPLKFNLVYTDKDGQRKTPVVIHRVIYGSIERFMGILIEHFAGNFPYWITAEQVGVVPVSEASQQYAEEVYKALRQHGVRAKLGAQHEQMGALLKQFRAEKVPYTIIVGENEKQENKISLKIRGGKQVNMITLQQFLTMHDKMEQNHLVNLIEEF